VSSCRDMYSQLFFLNESDMSTPVWVSLSKRSLSKKMIATFPTLVKSIKTKEIITHMGGKNREMNLLILINS
jgi:hypothetical protein